MDNATNNNITVTDAAQTECSLQSPSEEKKLSKGRKIGNKIHFIVGAIFFGLATVAFVIYSIMAGDLLMMISNPPENGDFSTNLGHGLGTAFSLVIVIIFGIICAVISAVSGIISGVGIGIQRGPFRFICIGFAAASALYIVSAVVLFIITLRLNEFIQANTAALTLPLYL